MLYRFFIGVIALVAVHYHGIYAGLFVLTIAALWDIAEAIRESK